MDFAPTTLFVVPVGNSLPTSGSTENLSSGQFGIFKDKLMAAATAGNVGAAQYIQLAQGRPGTSLGTKRSDRIKASNVSEWYKVAGHSTAADEIWELSAFSAKKGESLSISVITHSTFADLTSYNGLVQNITIETACLNCGDDPCAVVPNESIVDQFMAKISQTLSGQDARGNSLRLDSYLTWEKIGTGDSAKIRITSKPVRRLAEVPENISSLNISKDRVWFRPFVYKGTATTQDFFTSSACDIAATTVNIQRSSFATGSADEIRQMERDFATYQQKQKHLFSQPGWNQEFVSYVDPSKTYDVYYIRFKEIAQDSAVFAPHYGIDWRVALAIPNDATTGIEAILAAYLGAVTDQSGVAATTTTTTSSAPTTTTTTTHIIP